MSNTISRDSSLIRNASISLTSFYTKHPLLALITTISLSVIAVIGFIYRKDAQNEQASFESVKNGNLKSAEESASKIYFSRIRDKAYERLSIAYIQKYDLLNAHLITEKITNKDIQSQLLSKIRIKKV